MLLFGLIMNFLSSAWCTPSPDDGAIFLREGAPPSGEVIMILEFVPVGQFVQKFLERCGIQGVCVRGFQLIHQRESVLVFSVQRDYIFLLAKTVDVEVLDSIMMK